jgi:tRNA 5-methylaminomethyl-2-thiouridine biosynthesis bifunctional protein
MSDTVIIGAGIAGATLARALAERGIPALVLERATVGAGASGNPVGALYPHVTKYWHASSAWHFTAYAYALRRYRQWSAEGLAFDFTSPGMVKIAMSAEEEIRLRGINTTFGIDPDIARWCDAKELCRLSGIKLTQGGVWFAQGSSLSPLALCRALLTHPDITLVEDCNVQSVTRGAHRWQITTQDGRVFDAARVILANAHAMMEFCPKLPLGVTAGQISFVDAAQVAFPVRVIFCHKGYVVPHASQYVIGATYDRRDITCDVTASNHAQNFAELEVALPGWTSKAAITGGRAALRAATPDRLPYVGALGEGLYVSAGFGSRGLISAPLAAEVLASALCGDMVPLTADVRGAIDPARKRGGTPRAPTPEHSAL